MLKTVLTLALSTSLAFGAVVLKGCGGQVQIDKWTAIQSALAGGGALVESFGVKPEIASELTKDFSAISAGVQAYHDGKGTPAAVLKAINALAADGSKLLQGANAQRVEAIVAFLKPFFPSAMGVMASATREPTDADVKKLKELMRPLS